MTLSIMTFIMTIRKRDTSISDTSITTLSIQLMLTAFDAECSYFIDLLIVILLNVVMLSVVVLNVFILSVFVLSVFVPNVIKRNVIILNVVILSVIMLSAKVHL